MVTVKFVDMNGQALGKDLNDFDTSQFLWQILNNTGYAYPHFDESAIREPMYRNIVEDGEAVGESQISRKGHHISTKVNFKSGLSTWRTITTPEKSSNIANSSGLGL